MIINDESPLVSFTHLISPLRSFSLDEVQAVLKSSGFSQVKSAAHLEGQSFCRDPHCGDLLVFPAGLKPRLNSTNLLTDHKLTIQVKAAPSGWSPDMPDIFLSVDLNMTV